MQALNIRRPVRLGIAGLAAVAGAIVGVTGLVSPSTATPGASSEVRPCKAPDMGQLQEPAPQEGASAKRPDGSSETTFVLGNDVYSVNRCDARGQFATSQTVLRLRLPSGRTAKFVARRVEAQPDGTYSVLTATPTSDVALLEASSTDQAQSEIPEPTREAQP